MLEKVPAAIGHALEGVRPGLQKLVYNDAAMAGIAGSITVTSPAFEDGGPLPARYTEDGERLSPPLEWIGVPPEAQALVLLVEDADSPSLNPLVHAIVWDLPGGDGGLPEGGLASSAGSGEGHAMGRNSFLGAKYLAPDPPTGHGPHRYAFQVFALDRRPELDGTPGRGALLDAMKGRVLAKGCLIGTYQRV